MLKFGHPTRKLISIGGAFAAANPAAAVGTAALGGAGDYFSAKSLQNDAQSRNREDYKNAVQWRVKDLRKAGINPILAAGMGLSGGIAGSPIGSASPGSTAVNALNVNSQRKLRNQEINTGKKLEEQYKSQKELNDQLKLQSETTARKIAAEARVTEGQGPLADLTGDYYSSELGRLMGIMDLSLGGDAASTALKGMGLIGSGYKLSRYQKWYEKLAKGRTKGVVYRSNQKPPKKPKTYPGGKPTRQLKIR